ncbi:hypothetical protein POTOM_014573 [Populus tomentosa]|uniref:Disease resistance RPP13-like protein 1 n=1 Tax=Populus tomentosa TaxID=118781 RepID=A0A8X8A7V6_POPTO|nr:hypothetical protein POTOM_014573 [Populus tomentosa]
MNDRPLKRLKTAMIPGRGLLDDAEEKQITNTAVRDWLVAYKDAVYEADDFLDEIAYEDLRQELEAEAQIFINPREIMGLREIEKKSRGLQESLDDLVKQKDALGLINRTGKAPSSPKRQTTSLVDESGVCGRDDNSKAILKLLLSDDANGKNPGVVPIVGMGGVGKTTLAQLVYNHSRVQEWFGLKAWVCVSEDFSVSKLTKVILEAFGSKAEDVSEDNLDQLQTKLGENNSSKAIRRARHFSLVVDTEDKEDMECVFSSTGTSTILENIREAQLLRTFQTFPRYLWCPPEIYNEIFQSTLGRLRVLFMKNGKVASMLSCSTSKLKHLRYLDLSHSYLVTLPEEVSALLNLQTLILKGCKQLATLPDLGNLKYLRHLNLEGTGIERLPESLERLINLRYLNISDTPLKEMPQHIGQLTKLQTLTAFLVGRHSETSFRELGKLQHLRGELHIRNLQNVVDARDAGEANLKGKKHLDKLRFTWDGYTHDPQHVRSTLEKLEPNRKVKDLEIDGYGGRRFPEWVGKSTFSKIVSLKLSRCENCTSLPPLGQLASLEELSIEAFDKVVTVGSEFYGNCTAKEKPFKSLKTLRFEWMPEWREWISDELGSREAFPLLEVLSIKKCPNLTKALPGHNLPRLTSLIIEGCEELATPLPRFPRLLSLDVCECHSLESLPEEIDQMGCSPSDLGKIEIKGCDSLKCVALDLVPNLNYLSISGCLDLESLCAHERPLNDLNSLHSLTIDYCPKLVSFPKGGLPAPVLTELNLEGCSNLKQLPESMHSLLPSLTHLGITGCSEVELCPERDFPSTLQSLEISDCNKLIAGRMQTLPSLSHFEIGRDKNVESLTIDSLQHLNSLNYKGLQHLTSLTSLRISDCPLIESMPEEGLPSSLSYLEIHYCFMLKSLPRLQHLTSLRELDISCCPLIESMPEEGLPSSLFILDIYYCPMLGESCEREKGKDWPKISHIPYIDISTAKK